MPETNIHGNTPTMRMSISRKTLISILLMAFVLSVTAIIIGYNVYSSTMDQHYIDNTVHLSRTAAELLDVEAIEHYSDRVFSTYQALAKGGDPENEAYLAECAKMENEPAWKEMRRELQIISKENDLMSMLVVTLDQEAHSIIYVVDSDDTETYCPPGTVDDTMTDQEIADFVGSNAVISNTEEFGWLISGGAPLYNESGRLFGLVIIDISMNDVMQDRHDFLVNYCLILLLITALLSVVMTWSMRRQVVVPINKLAKAATDYSRDRSEHEMGQEIIGKHFSDLNIRTGDELENLSYVMSDMETQLAEYIKNLTRVTAEKERIGAELNVATQIQADMLPRIFPAFPHHKEFDIYATMTPAKEVGGDFYDFFLIDDNHIGLVMADVSGKGVPAALFMVIAKTLIKNQAQTCDYSPAKVLEKVNEQLCEGNEADLFVTVWLAILDLRTGKGMAANAGHEHPALRRADGSYELVVYRHSMAVAAMEDIPFKEHEFELHPGDSLFVYTDGVAEATNAHDELYGTERMIDALNKNPAATPQEILTTVKSSVDEFVGDAPQFDDITMLCFKYFGSDESKEESEHTK